VTDDELEEIRKRHKASVYASAYVWDDKRRGDALRASAADVPALLAEVEMLRRMLDGLAARVAAQEGPSSPPA
jgi:hypothetical protein